MNKLLKWLLAVVGFVAVLLVVLTVVLPRLIDPNNYKEEIRTAVFDRTGRELTIGGEIEWTVFPSIGLDLTNLSLSNRTGFGDQPMLKVDGARASVKLVPLFSRKLEIGQVNLTGVSAYLRQNTNGQNNWEDLAGTSSGDAIAGVAAETEIEISNGIVTLQATTQTISLDKFGGSAGGIELGQPFELKGELSVNMLQEELAGDVQLDGLVQPATNGKWFGLEDIDVSFKGQHGPAGRSKPLDLNVNANAELDLAGDKATLSDLVFRFFNIKINGKLEVTSLAHNPVYTGQFALAEFSPKKLLQNLDLAVPQTRDESALTKMSGDMRFNGSQGSFNMQELALKLDKSSIQGSFSIEGTEDPLLAYNFGIDKLDLDDYATPEGTDSGESADTQDNEPAKAFGIFFVMRGGGDLNIGELVANGLTITDINVRTNADVNALRVFPISAKLYGGEQQGDIKIDISGSRPILTTNQVLTGIQVDGLLKDLTGNARLQGTGDFYMKISTDLTSSETARRTLSGDIGISVIDGAIVGIDVADTINFVASALGRQKSSATTLEQDKKTEFAEFMVSGIFNKGVLKSDDLMMLSPLFSATGKGTVNLVNETVNYVLKPVLVNDINVEGLDKVTGVPIPVKITGNMYEPDITVDIMAGLTGSQKSKLDAKKNELADSVLDAVFGSSKDKKKKKKKDDG